MLLKYNSELINDEQLKKLIQSNLKGEIATIDYIGYLESTGELNQKLLKVIQQIYPKAEVVEISKMKYINIDDAIDWEQFRKESKKIQDAIVNYLYKTTAEKNPPYKIRKSGEVQSSIIQRMHSKYDLGLNPNVPNKTLPPIYDVFINCITQNKKLLIIDDNIHTGTDFVKIFRIVDELSNKMIEEASKKDEIEEKTEAESEQIKTRLKRSPGNPDLLKIKAKLDPIIKTIRDRTENIIKNYSNARNNIYGYVLYMLKPEDLK